MTDSIQHSPHVESPEYGDRSPRILITRLSAIGDCILTMPLAVALRDAFPSALIGWVVEGVAGTMIERHPAVDLAIRLPRRFARSPRMLWEVRRRMRDLRFDVAIDPQSLTKSSLIAYMSGARRRIGFARPIGREIAPWLNTELVHSRSPHVVDRYLDLMRPLGPLLRDVRFDFPRDEPGEAKTLSAILALVPQGRFAVLNPGAGWESKRWPAERYAELAKELERRWAIPSVVMGAGPQELRWANQIAGEAKGSALVGPDTTLLELGTVLRKAALFVGSDTGPLHMAAAVGTPCVGIYGPTKPQECGPYGPGHQTVQAWYQGGTSRMRRNGPNDAMRDVPVEWVVEACGRILAAKPAESAA